MATIIEFYIPKSFQGRPALISSQRCGKVLPFHARHTENALTPVQPLSMRRTMFASETEQTRFLPKEIIFPTARNFEMQPMRAKES
jgi:hypothetical protein